MNTLNRIKKELKSKKNSQRATASLRYFKTGKGEYGEGDKFLGLKMPEQRKVAKKFMPLVSLPDTLKLLREGKYHEERMLALLLLLFKYQKANALEQNQIYESYLSNTKYINNWDLVDVTCRGIVGAHLYGKNKKILYQLAKSKNLWERRIAVVSTFYFIGKGDLEDTFKIVKTLLSDRHDLIHKACGWALREAGKKNKEKLERFLKQNIQKIPRTTLRYSVERFSQLERKKYLSM